MNGVFLFELIVVLALGIIFLEPKDFLFLIKKIYSFRENIFSFFDNFSFPPEENRIIKDSKNNFHLTHSYPYKILQGNRYIHTPLLLINKL